MNTIKLFMLAVLLFGLAGCGNVQEQVALGYVEKAIIQQDDDGAKSYCHDVLVLGPSSMATAAKFSGITYKSVESGFKKIDGEMVESWDKKGRVWFPVVLKGVDASGKAIEKRVEVELKKVDGKWKVVNFAS